MAADEYLGRVKEIVLASKSWRLMPGSCRNGCGAWKNAIAAMMQKSVGFRTIAVYESTLLTGMLSLQLSRSIWVI